MIRDRAAGGRGSVPGLRAADLVPRLTGQGYSAGDIGQRRSWVEGKTGATLRHVGSSSIAGDPKREMRGNIENPIGAAQVPLGVAGPLRIEGEHASGLFYVPLATTEGALVRSYERGMTTLTRAGGAVTRIYADENRVAPVFLLDGVAEARQFCLDLESRIEEIRTAAESTTRHGRLLRIECRPLGREVMVNFCYATGDAHGMNMIVKATDSACRWIAGHCGARRYYIFSGMDSEKRASGSLFAGGKGKKVIAGARLPAALVRAYLHVTPDGLRDLWQHTVAGHLQAGALGYNGHYANGLAALFIACGQDVANLANSAVGITHFEVVEGGDLYASVTLPSLTVATVGGGTALGTACECLEMLGCAGAGQAPKLAEIAAATLLAGELSMGAAIASGEFVAAHETYGRNRPGAEAPPLPATGPPSTEPSG
ncbi:MAG TPA: hydroxymethylglutaryl-CoA reductase [Thermoanaerobaculia bacterium]|nr:hydroxymethylglutaryl-CoA reductase [Thermoanaerobaculia bacterium]